MEVVARGRRVLVRAATRDAILALRHAVLRPGLPEDAARFDGDDDPATVHVGAFLPDGTPVGCVSLMPRPWRDAPMQLRGMATRDDVRGAGVGRALLAFVAATLPAVRLWCNARVESAGFYARHGWTVESAPFDLPGVGPHVVMRREAPR